LRRPRTGGLDLDDEGCIDVVDALIVGNEKQVHAIASEHRELRVINFVAPPVGESDVEKGQAMRRQ
jgi:hypothetical protein